jgi:hypothetical protein
LHFLHDYCIIALVITRQPRIADMDAARELTSPLGGAALPYSVERHATAGRPETIVLQVDASVSGVDGLTWLTGRRDASCGAQLAALQTRDSSWAEVTQARLKLLRPRRAEINELGAAYRAALVPGAADAVAALRRAGVSVKLASDVAAEALFGVAAALGVGPDELLAPHLRFDAIGAFVGSAMPASDLLDDVDESPDLARGARVRWFVGTRRSAMFAPRGADAFVAFTGVVAREGLGDALASVSSFGDLTALALR